VDFVELGALTHFDIATNAVCVYLMVYMRITNVSTTNTRMIALCVEKTCSLHVNLHRIFLVATPYMLTVFDNWLVLIIDAQFAKRPSSHLQQWQPHGMQGHGISQSNRCQRSFKELSILCATIARRKAMA
jgi:hypothetical protein